MAARPPFNLDRFVEAQDRCYDTVLRELRDGRKRTHWMWFIFPQIHGLGSSPLAQRYAIRSLGEAAAYAEHAILGVRLRECTQLVIAVEGRTAEEIFSFPDVLKFRSCMTLFGEAASDPGLFREALDRYFAGVPDPRTLDLLERLE